MEKCSPSFHIDLFRNNNSVTAAVFKPFSRRLIMLFDCDLSFMKWASPNACKSTMQKRCLLDITL